MKDTSFRPFLLPSLVLFLGGWGGLALLVTQTRPTALPRWGAYALFSLALAGTALPVLYFFHWRFPETPPVGENILLRQTFWVSIYGTMILWLQQWRVATTELIFLLGIGFLLIEWLIRFRERSRSDASETPSDETAASPTSGDSSL